MFVLTFVDPFVLYFVVNNVPMMIWPMFEQFKSCLSIMVQFFFLGFLAVTVSVKVSVTVSVTVSET